jgi:hypothetical protein
MRIFIAVFLISILLIATSCDTELGHHEDHDHDGDGVQDHAPDEHVDEEHEHNEIDHNKPG